MNLYNLKDFVKGWFIGFFDNSIVKTNNFEIAIKKYKIGDSENRHLHKIATEYTVIISGKVLMNNQKFISGDIIEIGPNESTDFYCLEDTITCVVKIPSLDNDKFEI